MKCICLHLGGLVLIKGVFPIWTLVLIIGVLVAIVVACTSRNDRQPVYHCVGHPSTVSPSTALLLLYSLQVFAWLGFAIAVVWIYVIANEIVNLLQVFKYCIYCQEIIFMMWVLCVCAFMCTGIWYSDESI